MTPMPSGPGSSSPLRLVSYARVSTDEQADSGLGLAAQRHALERAFDYEGWTLVEHFVDEGVSGKDLHRPGLRIALELVAAGGADGLVVAKLDRLTRSVVDLSDLLDWFDVAGATFVALDLRLDTSSAMGEFAAHLVALIAQWERRTIGERTRAAMAAKRRNGEATGRPSVLENPRLLARVQELQSEVGSPSAIAAKLNEEGWPTVRGGKTWRASAVQTALGYQRPPQRRRRADLPPIPRRR